MIITPDMPEHGVSRAASVSGDDVDAIDAIRDFLLRGDAREISRESDVRVALARLGGSSAFRRLLDALIASPAFDARLNRRFAAAHAVEGLAACRVLRSALSLTVRRFLASFAQLLAPFADGADAAAWSQLARRAEADAALGAQTLLEFFTSQSDTGTARTFRLLAERLEREHPHALYPTSPYRESDGHVTSSGDDSVIEAVMSVSTFASVRVVDRVLDPEQPLLRDMYAPLGRCVCFVDETVDCFYGEELAAYFAHHGVTFVKHVYRALEADKTIGTVERMLGDLKAAGVSRNEPVLIVGGGVLADTAGLACSLYGRNTPYVMLSTSIVSGIDAGPSPRVCCDGYGYKNLLGSYHPPILAIVDRFFFKTLRSVWLRHGVAEIIKISAVRDARLFADLEAAQHELVETKFATTGADANTPISALSQRILRGALRAYVASEYDNLYETHQCRPHAFGHTWSPGFEIEAGLLHGHAVAICMGLGAYLSRREGWIDETAFRRILGVISGYGLSLRHDILHNRELMWKSQQIIVQKRGGNLVAPVPKGDIGSCGYLNSLSRDELFRAIDDYERICTEYPRGGNGVDAMLVDAEDSGTIVGSLIAPRG